MVIMIEEVLKFCVRDYTTYVSFGTFMIDSVTQTIQRMIPYCLYIYKTFSNFTIEYFKRAPLMKCIGLYYIRSVIREKETWAT